MKKGIVVLIFSIAFNSALFTSPHHMEISIGAIADKLLFDADIRFPDNYTYATASLGYMYKFSPAFSLGGWVGMMYNLPVPITGGLKLVFWDIDNIALAVNLGIVPSVGMYYKHLFLNVMPVGVIMESKVVFYPRPEIDSLLVRPYLELGYSIPF